MCWHALHIYAHEKEKPLILQLLTTGVTASIMRHSQTLPLDAVSSTTSRARRAPSLKPSSAGRRLLVPLECWTIPHDVADPSPREPCPCHATNHLDLTKDISYICEMWSVRHAERHFCPLRAKKKAGCRLSIIALKADRRGAHDLQRAEKCATACHSASLRETHTLASLSTIS